MSQNIIVALQSLLIFLQIVNGQIAVVTHNALVALIISAVVGAVQYYVQNAGNASLPPGAASADQVEAIAKEAAKITGPLPTPAASNPRPKW